MILEKAAVAAATTMARRQQSRPASPQPPHGDARRAAGALAALPATASGYSAASN